MATESDTIPVGWRLRRVLVRGPSMAPTLRHGDHLLVWWGAPQSSWRPGAIVLVALPERPLSVKRLDHLEPDGRVRVSGDNPFGSTDSRDLGDLPAEALRARVIARLWPSPAWLWHRTSHDGPARL